MTSEGQLEVVRRTLASMETVAGARRHYLEDRTSLVSGGDWIHNYQDCDVDDLCNVLEMEMSVTIPGDDKQSLIQSMMAMFDHVLDDSEDTVTKLVETLSGVWKYHTSDSSRVVVETVVQCLSRVVTTDTWRHVYHLCPDKHSDIMLQFWYLLPDNRFRLDRDDLNIIVKELKQDHCFALPLIVTKLIIRCCDDESFMESIESIGYWFARGRITLNKDFIRLDACFNGLEERKMECSIRLVLCHLIYIQN